MRTNRRSLSSSTDAERHWRSWIRNVLASVVCAVGVLVSMNVLIDPYEVFHSQVLRPASTANERYNKMAFLLEHPQSFNALLLGSSRMGVFDPARAEALRAGTRYYNLSAFSGTPQDSLLMLKTLIGAGAHINEVVLGLDISPFIQTQAIPDDMSLRHHPRVLGQSPLGYYADYLFDASWVQSLGKLKAHWSAPNYRFHFVTDGHWELRELERRIQDDPVRYVQQMFRPPRYATPPTTLQWIDARFDELRELIRFLDNQHIQLYAFVHPFSDAQQQKIQPASLNALRQRWHAIIPHLVDFSIDPQITHNRFWYYEETHYRPVVAHQILERLFEPNQPSQAGNALALSDNQLLSQPSHTGESNP